MKAGKYNMNNNFSDKYEQIQKINKAYTNTDWNIHCVPKNTW